LKAGGDQPLLEDGTVHAGIDGRIKTTGGTWIDLPLNVMLKQTHLNIPKVGRSPNPVDLPVTVHLKGPIDRPQILFDHEAFVAALQKAGLEEMAGAYRQKYEKQLQETVATKQRELEQKAAEKQKELETKVTEKTDEAQKKVDEKVSKETDEATKKLQEKLGDKFDLGNLTGGDKKEAEEDKTEDPPKEDETKKAVDDAIKGLFDRK
ncbi:MAG: hypothetical protein R3236_11265, partial [Phycisphaeraceae bacterium]|nr:hypothetical protein [Phycisphaeraceae bacterium]